MKLYYIFLAALFALTAKAATAQSINNKFEVDGLFYRITNLAPNEVKVVSELEPAEFWESNWNYENEPSGALTIPSIVTDPNTQKFSQW